MWSSDGVSSPEIARLADEIVAGGDQPRGLEPRLIDLMFEANARLRAAAREHGVGSDADAAELDELRALSELWQEERTVSRRKTSGRAPRTAKASAAITPPRRRPRRPILGATRVPDGRISTRRARRLSSCQHPTAPSTISRMRSACPLCRAYSSIMWL